MKIKQVEQILKSDKTLIIYEGPNCQWLGCRGAIYPAYNLPRLDETSLFAMLDILADDRSKYYFKEYGEPGSVSLDDVNIDEKPIERNMFQLYKNGCMLEPLKTSQGIVFINCKYLRPFANEVGGIELYERKTSSDTPYIAVKSGFMLAGIIFPHKAIDDIFIQQCEQLYQLSKDELYRLDWTEETKSN